MKQIAIIGLGLMGCSVALAVKKSNPTTKIIGFDKNKRAHYDYIDEIKTKLADIIPSTDMIILATPVGAVATIFSELNQYLNKNIIIIDICSVKKNVVETAKKYIPNYLAQFIPCHPIAGSEKRGGENAITNLFENNLAIITPLAENNTKDIATVKNFWKNLKANIVKLTPEEHDAIFAYTSHLPHALAMALVNSSQTQQDKLQFVGQGFKLTTKIGKANPLIWRDIFTNNKAELLFQLSLFRKQLQDFEKILQENNQEELLDWIGTSQQLRQKIED